MKRLLTYIIIVLVLSACTTKADHARMRSGLDSINVLNRNSQPFTIDDVQPYVDYFDRHGNGNDRLLAHYLLGRAYHEAGEAPMALECYQHSLECADTTAADCDYYQLSRVHAQMAELYYQLHLYPLQIEAYRYAINFSMKSGNEQAAMNDLEQLSSGYEQMGMSDSALFFLDSIASWYERHGLLQDAAITRGRSLSLLISQKNYQKAKDYMAFYERLSGLFNDAREIEKGYEIYYYYKGLVMLSEAKLDSAEYFFHKELALGKDLNNQNAGASGLVLLYESRHMPDSALKYSKYSYTMNDSLFLYTVSEDINRMKVMHDYSRMQQFANKKTEEANHERERRNILLGVLIIIVTISISILTIIMQNANKGLEKYKMTLSELRSLRLANKELCKHKDEYEHQILLNEQRITTLEKIISKYGKQLYFSTANAERCLKGSPTYTEITKVAIRGEKLTEVQLQTIQSLLIEYFPGFDDFMATYMPILKEVEYYTCILLRLHFKAVDIANMLGVSKSQISQVSTEVVRKLFNVKGSSKELSARLSRIF